VLGTVLICGDSAIVATGIIATEIYTHVGTVVETGHANTPEGVGLPFSLALG
jgi:hypothetical protein